VNTAAPVTETTSPNVPRNSASAFCADDHAIGGARPSGGLRVVFGRAATGPEATGPRVR
jgi:hypothetical protein